MKTVIIVSFLIFLLIVTTGIFLQLQQLKTEKFEFPKPVEVVKKYFESWDKKNWVEVYAAISDGFKKNEPTAKTLSDFKQYAVAQNLSGVNTLSIEEKENDGKTAVVGYLVEFVLLDGTKRPFSGSFTLKFREADIIRGWKIINPYGDKMDTS